MPELIRFKLDPGQFWHESERTTIQQAAIDVGKAVIRESGRIVEQFPHMREFLSPARRRTEASPEGGLDPGDVFLKVFGRPVTFFRRDRTPGNPGTWGETISRDEIWIFKTAPHTAESAAAVGNRVEFAVHELGHAYENVILAAVGRKKGRESLPPRFMVRRDPLGPDPNFDDGFVLVRRFQQSPTKTNGEIFADMFIGWVYDRWRETRDGRLTAFGADRKRVMDGIMLDLLQSAILHNFQETLPAGTFLPGMAGNGRVIQKGRTTDNLRLRSGPGFEFPTLEILPPKKKVDILRREGDWYLVRVGVREGYVHHRFVALEAVEEEVSTPIRDMEVEPEAEEVPTAGRSFTTTYLNFRVGPGTDQAIISVLKPNTPVEIIGESGDWLKVKVEGQEGFVHRNFVSLTGPVPQAGGFVPFDTQIEGVDFKPIPIQPGFTSTERLVAETWNKYGGMLTKFAQEIGVDPAVLAGLTVGVLIQESGGDGFRNGKLLIRFENQLFFDSWGSHSNKNKKKFEKHFTFNQQQRWLDHAWRKKENKPFQSFHGNQAMEWEVLTFAGKIDDTAAKKSISMGMPQILGLNYAAAGFNSVLQMFEVFSIDNQHQLNGFFTFVKNRPRLRQAVIDQDYLAFAASYNGPGQAARYRDLIMARIADFERIHDV